MNKTLVITLFSAAAFVVGCKPSATDSTSANTVHAAADKVEDKAKDASQATKELAQAKKEYAYAQKTEYVAEKQTELAAINRELDALSAKIELSSDATKADAKPKLQALRDQSAKLGKQLDDAKSASESTWESVKSGSSKAYDDLKEAFQHARQWTSDKIAP